MNTNKLHPVKRKRLALGWTQGELARRASRFSEKPIPICTVCRIEQGRAARIETLRAIRRALGQPLDIRPVAEVGRLR